MAGFVRKFRHPEDMFIMLDDKIGETDDESELALQDDEPFMSPGFAGKLSFAGADSEFAKDIQVTGTDTSPNRIPYEGSSSGTCRVVFEVTSAEVIKDTASNSVLPSHSSHVDYTITMSSNRGMQDVATCIIRRYSHFEQLHKALKKKFPQLLATVVFPNKILLGNFTTKTIAKRSRAFEQYLTHLYSLVDIRYSSHFTDFFTGDDYHQGIQALLSGNYFQAVESLERCLPVLEKLFGNSHRRLSRAVCALVVSHARTTRVDVAHSYAMLAADSLPESAFTVPLLQMLVRLSWSLGCDKTDVEERLRRMKEGGVDVDSSLDLEEEMCRQLKAKCL